MSSSNAKTLAVAVSTLAFSGCLSSCLFGGHDDSSNMSITGDIRSADSSAYVTVPK